jgi:hypothetical protein
MLALTGKSEQAIIDPPFYCLQNTTSVIYIQGAEVKSVDDIMPGFIDDDYRQFFLFFKIIKRFF